MIKNFVNNSFVKSVSVLMTGTILSQVVNYAFTPILSRIYTVEEMADLSIFLRVSAFIIGLATARYEMSLPLPKNDHHSFLLYRVAVKIASYVMIFAGIVGLIYLFFLPFAWFNIWFLLLVLLGSIFVIMTNLGTNWSIRNNTFRLISKSRIINAASSNVFKLGFGFLKMGSIGLLFATVIGYFAASLDFIKEYFKNKNSYKHVYSKSKQRVLMLEYKQFPLVNLPHNMSDLARDLLIASLVVLYFDKEVFGLYSYSILILNIPIALIGTAVSQVFYNKASKMVDDTNALYNLVKKTMISLFLLSIIPFTVLYFFAEDVFVLAFGEQWRMAGTYAAIMIPYNLFNFVVAPMANLSLVLNRQKELFISALINSSGQIAILLLLPLAIGRKVDNFTTVLWVLTLFQASMMIINAFLYLYYSSKGKKK